jgi:hypothetical protein
VVVAKTDFPHPSLTTNAQLQIIISTSLVEVKARLYLKMFEETVVETMQQIAMDAILDSVVCEVVEAMTKKLLHHQFIHQIPI